MAYNNSTVDVLSGVLAETSRRLAESAAYDPVRGSLFANEHFEPWLLGLVTVFVIGLGSLAAGAGIGGGGLFVPLFAFALGVGAKAAVPMSKATILGGAIGNMISIAFARHPDLNNNKPLIDYEACTFMQSGELLGVVFGVLLNILLPEILIIVFLACLLSFNAYKTLSKGMQKYRDETKKMMKAKEVAAQSNVADASKAEANGAIGPDNVEVQDPAKKVSQGIGEASITSDVSVGGTRRPRYKQGIAEASFHSDHSEFSGGVKPKSLEQEVPVEQCAPPPRPSEVLQKILDEESAQFPLWSWAFLVPMTIYTIVYAIMKSETFSVCYPAGYWLWYFSPVPVLGGFMYATAVILKRRNLRKVAAGYVFIGANEESPDYRELIWDNATLKHFPTIAVLAGVAAGLLGIGGGMVIGPLFIHLDMQPKVGSSSCAFMILWTALSGVVQYYFAGKLGWEFIVYGVVVGIVSGQIGQTFVDYMLKKSGRPSFVIFLLGGIILAACIAMTCTGVVKLVVGVMEGEDMFKFDTYDFECHN